MNTAPTAITSQSQTLKPSSIPSATVRAMIKVKAATVAQLLTRECDPATSSFRSVDPVGGFIASERWAAQLCGGRTTRAAMRATPGRLCQAGRRLPDLTARMNTFDPDNLSPEDWFAESLAALASKDPSTDEVCLFYDGLLVRYPDGDPPIKWARPCLRLARELTFDSDDERLEVYGVLLKVWADEHVA